jgi:hypothetical protein
MQARKKRRSAMDDWEMARMTISVVRKAVRLAEQEQRRRERQRQQDSREAAAQNRNGQGRSPGRQQGEDTLQRRPEFAMPSPADGEIPDEFLPHI